MKKGIILILCTAVISGFSIFLNAMGVKGLDPYAFTGAKNTLVALALLGIILLGKNKDALTKKDWAGLAAIGLVGGSIPFLLFFKGLSMGTGATGSFIHKTMIVWVLLGSAYYLKDRLNWKVITGALLLLIGNAIALKLTIGFSEGLILILLATLLWSAEIIIAKKLLCRLQGTTIALGRMGFGAVFILAYLLFTGHLAAMTTWNGAAWGWIALTSLLLLGYVWTFYNGLKSVSATLAVAVLSVGSVITTALQLLFSNAALSPWELLGAGIIMAGAGVFIHLSRGTHPTFSTA